VHEPVADDSTLRKGALVCLMRANASTALSAGTDATAPDGVLISGVL